MEEFNLDYQYQLYLQRTGHKEETMQPQQKIETKRAFMGACGQMLILLRDGVANLDEDQGIDTLKDMLNQVGDFWLQQSNQSN